MGIGLFSLWFVCGLGTVAFAALAPAGRRGATYFAVGIVVGAWLFRQPFAPPAPAVGLASAVLATTYLVRSPQPEYALGFAGLLAGVWIGVMELEGVPLPAAVAFAGTLPAVSAFLRSRRPTFAPPLLREEALLFMVVLGVVAAAAPGVTDGWRAAVNLNLQVGEGKTTSADFGIPAWTLAVASLALVSGGVYSLWSRR